MKYFRNLEWSLVSTLWYSFLISLVLIPVVLSYLPSPKSRHTKYLHNPRLNVGLTGWNAGVLIIVNGSTVLRRILAISIAGIFRLKSVGILSTTCQGRRCSSLVVGDVTGSAHFTTDLCCLDHYHFIGSDTWHFTLRDRVGGSPRVITKDIVVPISSTFAPASLTTALGASGSYFGPLTIDFMQAWVELVATGSASITAPSAGGGTNGSAVPAVGCSGIARIYDTIRFKAPPANHRLNLGVASAELNSCGVFAAEVEIWINDGPHVIVAMPGESIELNDITGAGGAQFGDGSHERRDQRCDHQ